MLTFFVFGNNKVMLDKKEKIVMNLIFEKCQNDNTHLFSAQQLIDFLNNKKYAISFNELEEIISSLAKESLIDYVQSESKNGVVYCVGLKSKGKLFKKDLQKERRYASWLILRTALLAVLGFIIGVLLRVIF